MDSQTPLLLDIDNDCQPELITPFLDGTNLRVFNSESGFLKLIVPIYLYKYHPSCIAISDIDKDNKPEIFLEATIDNANPINIRGKLLCYNSDGSLRWVSDRMVDEQLNEQDNGIPGFADFNQDGIPEIYLSNKIFNAVTGKKLLDGGKNGIGVEHLMYYVPNPISVAAQLDNDSTDLELAAGYTIYKVKIVNPNSMIGNTMIANNIMVNNQYRDGFTSVSDINQDGLLDVIVTCPGDSMTSIIYAYTFKNNMLQFLAQRNLPGHPVGIGVGPASIGKISLSNYPSILVTRPAILASLSYNGTTNLNLDWVLSTTDSSGYTGVTLFDFNNDGISEIVHRDETDLRIINGSGKTPIVLGSHKCNSGTGNEYPIVADLDNTGHAKICVPCSDALRGGGYSHLTIFGPPDSLPGWAPARKVWNQYAYNPLQINDDLTVPRVQKNQATYMNGKYNNFMQQESLLDSNGMYKVPAASLSAKIKCINYDAAQDEYVVTFDVYNRQNASAPGEINLAVSFYNGNPETSGIKIGEYKTNRIISNGDTLHDLTYRFKTTNLSDLFIVVNTTKNTNGKFEDKDFVQLECDYTDNMYHTLDIPKVQKESVAICEGEAYDFYGTSLNSSGLYYHNIPNTKNCDSVVIVLDLKTRTSNPVLNFKQVCDSITINNITYTKSGLYNIKSKDQYNCDSLTILNLLIYPTTSSQSVSTNCDSYSWNGKTYNSSGIFTYKTQNTNGCDSTATLDLTINKSDSINITHHTCMPYTWNGQTYTQSGKYSYQTQNQYNCDSTVILDLTINPNININIKNTACDSLFWNGQVIKQSGNYTHKATTAEGCDSTTTLQAIITNSTSSSTNITVCEQYNWNNNTYTQSGTYTFKTQNTNNCDSTAILNLTINKNSQSKEIITSCDHYFWHNIDYTKSGIYTFTTLNAHGCDSIITLDLSINKADTSTINQTSCDQYHWNGKTYNQSGSYTQLEKNKNGCDSLVQLNLNILQSTQSNLTINVCDSLNIMGQTLRQTGQYTFIAKNQNNCDSSINLDLHIRSTQNNTQINTCDSIYHWSINNFTYTSSGIYNEKFINSFGCDSLQILNLTLNPSYQIFENKEACKSYTWTVNHKTYNTSGDYQEKFNSIYGCDSILNLHLTIYPDYTHADSIQTSTSYIWPVNNKKYTTSGLYQEDYYTIFGCDSIHYLYLIIKDDIGIYYPNIIHPYSIQENSSFTIFDNGHSVEKIQLLQIYDRWGELIWQADNIEANNPRLGWNGKFKDKNVLPGVYVWTAKLLLKDGSVVKRSGDVTVVP